MHFLIQVYSNDNNSLIVDLFTGWILGTLLMVIAATSSSFALHTLSLCALKSPGESSFNKVASSAVPFFANLVDLAVVIKCFGVGISYLIVIGDLMPDVMDEMNAPQDLQNRYLWVAIGFCVVAPLSCLEKLDALRHTSLASVTFVLGLTLVVILYSTHTQGFDPCKDVDDDCVGEKENFAANVSSLRVFSIFIFGFTCHQVIANFNFKVLVYTGIWYNLCDHRSNMLLILI